MKNALYKIALLSTMVIKDILLSSFYMSKRRVTVIISLARDHTTQKWQVQNSNPDLCRLN